MNRFDRVVSILVLLQSRNVVRAQDISERFDVSLRTVYRDIRTLEEAGIPIYGEAGVGYSLADGYRLPPANFNQAEVRALTTAEKFMQNIADEPTVAAYKSAIVKIRAVLEPKNRQEAERLDDSILLRSAPRGFTKYLDELFGAIAGRWVTQIKYRKPDGMDGEWRDLEPIGCYYDHNTWYLIAWCRLRSDYRTFRVTRIEDLKLTAEHYDGAHPSVSEYIEREAHERQTHRVEVRFPKSMAEYVANDSLNFGLVLTEEEGEFVKMTFLVPYYDMIARWLLMYTKYVEIVAPAELNELMRKLIEQLSNHYKEK